MMQYDELTDNNIDNIMMSVYGISESQYYNFNNDYIRQL